MPKLKTKKTLAKRIKITKKGKFLKGHVRTSHLKIKQSSKTKRRKSKLEEVPKAQKKRVRRLLPYRK